MDRWLDSLSEDWVSQPRSPQVEGLRRSSSILSATSINSNTSQSRIPRYKPRISSSTGPKTNAPPRRVSSLPIGPSRAEVLKERTPSDLNASRPLHQNGSRKTKSPRHVTHKSDARHSPTGSLPSLTQNTVQQRASPTKGQGSTPEWKRRILLGNAGGIQPDLFGPIGLEKIFKPPTVGPGPKLKRKGLKRYEAAEVEEFPSSPPPYPSGLAPDESLQHTAEGRASVVRPMEAVVEESEKGGNDFATCDAHDTPPRFDKSKQEAGHEEQCISDITDDKNERLSRIALSRLRINSVDENTHKLRSPSQLSNRNIMSQQHFCSKSKDGTKTPIESRTPSQTSDVGLSLGDWTSHSLPDDLSTGTDVFVAHGGFVSLRRGGYSNDGSFHRRPLSPSSLPNFDASELRSPSPKKIKHLVVANSSSEAQKIRKVSRSAPATPQRFVEQKNVDADRTRSSGSPLKLFDKYDTFTNERLIRRMSTFEKSFDEETEQRSCDANSPKPVAAEGKQLYTSRTQEGTQRVTQPDSLKTARRISSFGEGELDCHIFEAEHPFNPSGAKDRQSSHASPQNTFKFNAVSDFSDPLKEENYRQEVQRTVHGKRLPYSPRKESQAKRRRTLRSSEEIPFDRHHFAVPAQPNLQRTQSLVGKKRKDALYSDNIEVADPKILAMRQKLRPRTPTHNQRSLHGIGAQYKKDDIISGSTQSLGIELDHQTQALAGELASFTLNIAQDMTQGCRKASVTTADFFNEAKQIMQLIRQQGRPQSNENILEEPEESPQGSIHISRTEQSTMDEFSRPPSREGGGIRPLREPAQLDARVVSHLRRFEDTDDLGLALPSSAKSMHINHSYGELTASTTTQAGDDIEVDRRKELSKVRALGHAVHDPKQRLSNTTGKALPETIASRPRSHGSQSDSGQSTGRSVPTESSRGSRSSVARAVIAPSVVSHLLPDQIAGMTFDHGKQVWVKCKTSQNLSRSQSHSRTGSELTEDLLRDIPDLSVDELEERRCTEFEKDREEDSVVALETVSDHNHTTELHSMRGSHHNINGQESSRPPTRKDADRELIDESLVPSKFSKLVSGGPIPETRATSWGNNEALGKNQSNRKLHSDSKTTQAVVLEQTKDVEHEISIFDGRATETPIHQPQKKHQARVVTVAFSSPLVDQILTLRTEDREGEQWDDESDLDLSESPPTQSAPVPQLGSMRKRRLSFGFGRRSGYRNVSHRGPMGSQLYATRPMSPLGEDEELSIVHRSTSQIAGLDVVVSTPLPTSRTSLAVPPSASGQHSSTGFQLSPLSEFTVHQHDELVNLDLSHVARRRGLLSMHEVEGKLSLSVQDLVKKLTDVEPYEPYWDYVKRVDLRNRKLLTLHMLDEFCSNIEELNVSGNELGQLNGAPCTVRDLKVRQNCLSNLTSWSHLQNLQYLDISGNQIQNLSGLLGLVHLRELKADDNLIENIDDILNLDGLIQARMRNNRVRFLDFEACDLKRLIRLDLHGNKLESVANADCLPSIKNLDFSNNHLKHLSLSPTSQIPNLETLNVSSNRLQDIDISRLPHLRVLNIDQNFIASIQGLALHRNLEILSWRGQSLSPTAEPHLDYQSCHSLRKLYLSSNVLPTASFSPASPFLNLQHLELASTGLQSLSEDFGLLCPNIRTLNLNYNALRDLRPLLGIERLESLHLVGNRIARLRRTVTVLERLSRGGLREVDLRGNGVCLGFYVPLSVPLSVQNQQQKKSDRSRELKRDLVVPPRLSLREDDDDEDEDEGMGIGIEEEKYRLPPADPEADARMRENLDEDTKIRRRVYEILVLTKCRSLERLDGLEVKARREAVGRRDRVWERLRELGILREK
ncbi:MAG: hypothetical protein Q9167_005943 [Letrouitia subvulpina]